MTAVELRVEVRQLRWAVSRCAESLDADVAYIKWLEARIETLLRLLESRP